MSRNRKLDLQMLGAARRANRIQYAAGAIGIVALIVATIALTLQIKSETESDANISATICAGWLLQDGTQVFADCLPRPKITSRDDAVIFNVANTGKTGISVVSASFSCVDGAACGIKIAKIPQNPGSSDPLPTYLEPGATARFVFPLGCGHEALATPHVPQPVSIVGEVELSANRKVSTNRIVLPPDDRNVSECTKASMPSPSPTRP